MADIDFFKRINDTCGHAVGDNTLVKISTIMKELLEAEGGYAGRWGGEEFMMLLPRADADKAYELAEKLRSTVESTEFEGAGRITVSLGTLCFDSKSDLKSIFKSLDDALYAAKEGGRNAVVRAN